MHHKKNVSKLCFSSGNSCRLSEGSDIDEVYSSNLEDENNNELENSISDPDYYVTADLLATTQWIRDM